MRYYTPSFQVGIISFLILFLELALIRFLPANILYFGYFTNFILLASFFGIGLGFLLAQSNKNLSSFFPLLLLLLVVCTKIFGTGFKVESNDLIFFKDIADNQPIAIPSFILLPFFYILISLVFASLSQILGKFFLKTPQPLKLYIFDILGSLLGIWAFYLLSFFGTPPIIWFLLISTIFIFLTFKKSLVLLLTIILLIFSTLITFDYEKNIHIFWTPYYKLSLLIHPITGGGLIFANNIHHQFFSTYRNSYQYSVFFNIIRQQTKLDDVLIIGSGSGQDVNAAIKAGAKNIDAVEILEGIYKIGLNYHPDKPYQNPKVRVHITDGRTFLKNTDKKYDVIIFALTDSLILNSGIGEVRLESYLFTKEAFSEAKSHLKDGGQFVLYNDYRKKWLIDRIDQMLQNEFPGNVKQYPLSGILASDSFRMFIAQKNESSMKAKPQSGSLPTDDWPFLYLKDRFIPSFYLINLMIITFITILTIFWILKKSKTFKKSVVSSSLAFFFLGAAFSLIETKSIVQLSLLFGSTWQVYVFAFSGILIAVLLGTLFSLKIRLNQFLLFLLLISSLIIQLIIPVDGIHSPNFVNRLLLSSLYFYLPIFFANLLFSHLFFKSIGFAQISLGFNILGLVLGGVLEYFALILGYSSLVYLALLLYILCLILILNNKTNN